MVDPSVCRCCGVVYEDDDGETCNKCGIEYCPTCVPYNSTTNDQYCPDCRPDGWAPDKEDTPMTEPMTLAEQLRELATWLQELPYIKCHSISDLCAPKADQLRALADYVDGRVVVGAEAKNSTLANKPIYYRSIWRHEDGFGSTDDFALGNLQERIDKRDGRTLP